MNSTTNAKRKTEDVKAGRFYIFSPFCLLRPTTNRIFDMRMADSLSGNGARVVIVHPYTWMKENIKTKDIPASYGLKNEVETRMLYIPLRENSSSFTLFVFMLIGFKIAAFRIALSQLFRRENAFILSRDAKSLIPAIVFKKIFGRLIKTKIIFMAAEVKQSRIYKWVVKNSDGIFAGVSTTRDAIMKIVNVPSEKFMLSLAPVPVYSDDVSKTEARKRINYTDVRPLAVYTGKLGIEVNELKYILQSAKLLSDVCFLFTGGRESSVQKVKDYCHESGIENCIFTGFFDDSTVIRNYQLAADVLLSYYTSKDHMIEFNYPQKINEYLSTGNPVITPDFPATRDVLNDKNVFFVAPDNPEALANGIRKILSDPSKAASVAAQAMVDIKSLTFDSKTRELIGFAKKLI